MASEQPNPAGASSTFAKFKSALGLPAGPKAVGPINTHPQPGLQRQDSYPEICSTPSEVGIFEVAHTKCRNADGSFSWRKFFFEAPGRPGTPRQPANGAGAAAPSSAAQ